MTLRRCAVCCPIRPAQLRAGHRVEIRVTGQGLASGRAGVTDMPAVVVDRDPGVVMIACCACCACVPVVPGAPGVPSVEELLALPHAELAAMCAEAYRVIAGMTVQAQEMTARVEELSRRAPAGGAGRGPGAAGGQGFLHVIEAPVVRQPVWEEAVAGPVAAGEGQAPAGEAAGRAGRHDEARG